MQGHPNKLREDRMRLALNDRFESLLKAKGTTLNSGRQPMIMYHLARLWLDSVISGDWEFAQRIAATCLEWSKEAKLTGAKLIVREVLSKLRESGQDLELYNLHEGSPLRELVDEPGGAFTGER